MQEGLQHRRLGLTFQLADDYQEDLTLAHAWNIRLRWPRMRWCGW